MTAARPTALAVIPARGGSKRLPRKNVVEFFGRPILAYTVQAALDAERFARVVVSTDDAEIAEAGAAAGAEIAWRGEALSGDAARVVDVCLDLLAREEAEGRSYEVLSVLYATAPLRAAPDVQAVVDAVADGGYTSALAVTAYPYPVHQALRPSETGPGLTPAFPELIRKRAAEAPAFRVDNGSTYAVRTQAFRANPGWYAEPLYGHEMPRDRSVDIDEPIDLELARVFFKQANGGGA